MRRIIGRLEARTTLVGRALVHHVGLARPTATPTHALRRCALKQKRCAAISNGMHAVATNSGDVSMRAMVFDGNAPVLQMLDLPDPTPHAGELLIDVHACGVCRTDLHVIDGELAHPKRPVI